MTRELIGRRRDARHNISINACRPSFWAFQSHTCSLHSVKFMFCKLIVNALSENVQTVKSIGVGVVDNL